MSQMIKAAIPTVIIIEKISLKIRLKIQPQQQKSLTPRPGLLNDLLGLLGGGIDGP